VLKETAHSRGVKGSGNTRKGQMTAVELQHEKEVAISYIYLKKVDELALGTWVEFTPLNESKIRCKLAVKLSENEHFVFVNRRGMKVVDWSRQHCASEMRKGRVNIIDARPLFDRALDTIVGVLNVKKKMDVGEQILV